MIRVVKMFEWENKFAMETLWEAENEYDYEVDEVVKVNNQYYAKLDDESYDVKIKLTKKEDKITKMTCNCKSRRRNCKHLAETLLYIEKYEIPEITFKHNSLTKYPQLSDVQFEKYLESDIQNLDYNEIKEFLVNLLVDYEKLYKNYILSFKKELNDKDTDIILRKLNKIMKLDVGVSLEEDKFYKPLTEFLNDEMDELSVHEDLSYKIYMKIYEKIVSIKYLIAPIDYEIILKEINDKINNNLKSINSENKEYIKSELNNLMENYPENLFSVQIMDLLGKLTDEYDVKTNIYLLKKQIDSVDGYEKEEYISQLLELMKKNKYSDKEIIENLKKYEDDFNVIKILIPYYLKENKENEAIESLEYFILNVDLYDVDRYYALIELKNLQFIDNDITKYTALTIKLIIEYAYYDEEDFDILKKENPNWNEIKEDIIILYSQRDYKKLYKFYIYNDMIEEFESEIFKYGDLNDISEFKEILIKKSPKKLQETYEKMIYNLLTVAKRSKYRKVAKILKEMEEIPYSKRNIKRIIKELKAKYPKRKALFQEIDKIS